MPIYEYLCENCETLTERMQKITDPAPRKCPECGSTKIAKLVSRTTFQLKGGGWYSDLYASPSKAGDKKGTHAERAGAPAPESAPKVESKPAAKPEGPASQPPATAKKRKRS